VNGLNALVTGSSRGIGLAIAEEFLYCGANVILNCDKSEIEMEEAARRLRAIGPDVMCIRADVSSYGECERMFEKIFKERGRLDVLVNNAGVSHVGLLNDMDGETAARIIRVNLCGAIYCSQFAAADMIKRNRGSIVNISSVWGITGASCETVYSASKGGLDAFTRALAKELGPAGVRVNAVACGVIETGMNDWLAENERVALCDKIPLGRFGTPGEIAKLAAFLAGDGSSYVTGQVIAADGGMI